jgi:hypothetical protein
MAGNEVTLTFAGDAQSLSQAAKKAQAGVTEMADSVAATGDQVNEANEASSRYSDGLGKVGAAAAGFSAAIGDAGGSLTAFSDFMSRGQTRAREQARALLDVEQASADLDQAYGDLRQAQIDLNQSMLDAKQAGIDAGQAQIDATQAALDASEAQKAYNEAVKEHGAGSAEAQQAAIDLKQAQADLGQANLDAEQAANDLKQATEDGTQAQRDATQAGIDAKGAALDLAEAQSNANPGTLARWGKELESITPLIMGVIGATNLLLLANELVTASWIKQAAAQVGARVASLASSVATGIATAAQWLWNAAFAASGIGLIVIGITALVAGIIYLATQTDFFGRLWKIIWDGILTYLRVAKEVWSAVFDVIGAYAGWVANNYKVAFSAIVAAGRFLLDQITAIPGRIGAAFKAVYGFITAPFRAAFNFVADAWNNTVGRLSWKVPGWVPVIGGNSFSAPRLPHFHAGGRVPGPPGREMLAVLQAGETVTSPAGDGGRTVIELRGDGSRVADALIELLAGAISRSGGLDVVFGDANG